MYNLQSTDSGVGVTDNYWGGGAQQYLNPALIIRIVLTAGKVTIGLAASNGDYR